jgi:hypothetical protein
MSQVLCTKYQEYAKTENHFLILNTQDQILQKYAKYIKTKR